MKIFVGLFITLCLMINNVNANPLTVRCQGSTKLWGKTIKVKIEIVLPDKIDKTLVTYLPENKSIDQLQLYGTKVGIGTIQINEQMGATKSSHRHKFIVTRLPSDDNSLIGFYVTGPYVNSIRANLWEKGKPFIYFDSYNNEVIKGHCE